MNKHPQALLILFFYQFHQFHQFCAGFLPVPGHSGPVPTSSTGTGWNWSGTGLELAEAPVELTELVELVKSQLPTKAAERQKFNE
jgi:hypothetical protein